MTDAQGGKKKKKETAKFEEGKPVSLKQHLERIVGKDFFFFFVFLISLNREGQILLKAIAKLGRAFWPPSFGVTCHISDNH